MRAACPLSSSDHLAHPPHGGWVFVSKKGTHMNETICLLAVPLVVIGMLIELGLWTYAIFKALTPQKEEM